MLNIDYSTIKEIVFWITALFAFLGFRLFIKLRRDPVSLLKPQDQRMINSVRTMWGKMTRNINLHGTPSTNPNLIRARQKIVKNVQSDPILGRFTKDMNEAEMFSFMSSDDFIRILRGFGITAQMGLGILGQIRSLIFGESEEEEQNVVIREKKKKGQTFKPPKIPQVG